MKRLLLFLAAVSAYAVPAPAMRVDWSCPRTMMAGFTYVCWGVPGGSFTFTVNPTTDVFTFDASYTPHNGDIIFPQPVGAVLPAGMYTYTDYSIPQYAVCGASGQTAVLKQFNCSGTQLDVTDAGTGTQTAIIYADPATYYLNSDPTGFPAGTTFAYKSPLSTTECNHTSPLSANGHPHATGNDGLCFLITIPSNATLSTVTTGYQWCGTDMGTNCTTFNWTVDVIALPSIPFNPPSSFTSMPGKAYWEGIMVARPCPGEECGNPGDPASSISGLANYCDPLAAPVPLNNYGAATSSTASMYGWNLPWDNAAIYTGNMLYRTGCFQTGMGHPGSFATTTLNGAINSMVTTFTLTSGTGFAAPYVLNLDPGQPSFEQVNCTTLTGNVYSGCVRGWNGATAASHSNGAGVASADLASVKAYVTAGNGVMLDFMHFTESLYRACRVLSDPSYCTAGNLMQNNIQPAGGVNPRWDLYRPVAFGLDDAVALKKYGGITVPTWGDIRNGMYSMVLRATESDASGVRLNQQAFQTALATHSLIADWQLSSDARAPYVIKRALDRIWADYSMSLHAWMNIEGPSPSYWCSNVNLWFTIAGATGNCGVNALNFQSLQIMITQAFYWYYLYSGDTTYRDRGDELFQHTFDQGELTGKQNSECYYDSFNAVGWRTGTLPITSWFGDATSPAPSGQVITGNAVLNGQVVFH